MAREEHFSQISPDVGEIDTHAFEELLDDDPDAALKLLATMAHATDQVLAALARRLAGRLALDLSRVGPAKTRGTGRLVRVRADSDHTDLDIDASLDGIVGAAAEQRRPSVDDLTATGWAKPQTALCLLVDRSGSMTGDRLAAAALAAAICAHRAPEAFSVLTFSDRVIEIKAIDQHRRTEDIVSDILRLRGHGTTDIALAIKAGQRQLSRSSAKRQVMVLLSDGESTAGGDPAPLAKALDEFIVLAPHDESRHAEALIAETGGRLALVDGPTGALAALQRVLQ